MGGKYEVLYWNWVKEEYISEGYTNSFFKAMSMVRKLERTWSCVVIQFRRNKVKLDIKSWDDVTMTDFED